MTMVLADSSRHTVDMNRRAEKERNHWAVQLWYSYHKNFSTPIAF